MLSLARVTLKHHRFEVVATSLAALALAAACIWYNSQLLAIDVPAGCFERWLETAGSPGTDCSLPVRAFTGLMYSFTSWLDPAMAVLPFAAGILTGVPVVARELETRTAQTAWSLSPSRTRWLAHQIWPIMLVVGAAVTVAAIASGMLYTTRANSFPPELFNAGFHGPIVAARAVAGFGIGTLIGTLTGRSLPAVIVAAVIALAAVIVLPVTARDAWARTQPRELYEWSDERPRVILDSFYRGPDGQLVPVDVAFALVPDNVEDPYSWLFDAGYVAFSTGISAETAAQWEGIENAGTLAVGALLVGATFRVVNRRRPI
jgi:hypothetical protein